MWRRSRRFRCTRYTREGTSPRSLSERLRASALLITHNPHPVRSPSRKATRWDRKRLLNRFESGTKRRAGRQISAERLRCSSNMSFVRNQGHFSIIDAPDALPKSSTREARVDSLHRDFVELLAEGSGHGQTRGWMGGHFSGRAEPSGSQPGVQTQALRRQYAWRPHCVVLR